ncbi:MAG: Outer membrane autotransporter barrel domain protein, partial [Candidatus Woesebacteria bacterium GW2011_GWC2_47_16]
DVSIAYDLLFTNQTASNIKTSAPFTLEVGESFESNDLTLKTYNSGDIVLDSPGGVTLAQAQAWDLADSSTTSLSIESGLMNFDTTNSRVGIGDTSPDAKLEVLATTEQLRLTYTDDTVDSRFTVDSAGDLTINNTGTQTILADDLQIQGGDLTTNQITAALFNTTATTLNIGGAATTNMNALTLSGHLTLSSDANEGASGGGLTDCDTTATSKLMWDATTNKFSCGTDQGGSSSPAKWSALTDPDTNLSLNHTATGQYTTTFGWTATGALDPWTMNITNNAGAATAQRFVNIVNTLTSQTVDVNTETLLRLDNADTDVAGSTVVDNVILITNSGGITNGITDAIDVSATEIVNAINVGANVITGTTANIDLTNFDVVGSTGNITVAAGVGLDTNAAGILTLGNTTATTINLGTTAATAINIGATGSLTRTIAIGTGTGADTINIGTGDTTADDINLGGLSTTTVDVLGTLRAGDGGITNYLQITSGGNLSFAGSASTIDKVSGTLNINTTNNQAITTGTGLLTSGGNLTFSGTTARTITGPSTGGLTLTVDSGALALSTTTSGNLTLTSAGALNLSAASASTWTLPAVANALNIDSNTLSIDALNNRVGIGQTSPLYNLDILNTAADLQLRVLGNSGVTASGIQLGAYVTLQGHIEADNSYRRLLLAEGAYWDSTNNRYELTNDAYDRAGMEITNSGYITFKTETSDRTTPGYMTLAEWDAIERMRITPTGLVGIGDTTPGSLLELLGSQPASVGTTPGTAATDVFTVTGGTGGNTSIATTGIGGIGADLALTGGTGGVAGSAATASTGGKGGSFTFTGGIGGAASVVGTGTNLGGAGGDFQINGGTGGAASGGTANTGGAGGDLFLVGGAAGSGGSPANGDVLLAITSGGTARGNVGIGDTSPDFPLEILSTTNPQFAISNADGTQDVRFGVDTSGNLTINAVGTAGYVRIGDTATPGVASGDDDLFVEGDLEVDGSITGGTTFNCTNCINADDLADTLDFDTPTETSFTLQANNVTTQSFLTVTTDGLTSGVGTTFDLTATGVTTAFSGDLVKLNQTQTYTGGAGTQSGNVLDIARSITRDITTAGDLALSGALATISDTAATSGAGTGTLTHSADVLRIAQNYTSNTGSALNVTSAGGATGFALRVNDDGTFTDSTPFVVTNAGDVGIGNTGSATGRKLDVNGNVEISGTTRNLYFRDGDSTIYFDENFDIRIYDFSTDGSLNLETLSSTGGDILLNPFTTQVGINTFAADKALEINSPDGNNLRLTYNDSNGSAANYTDFSLGATGDLTITPSGGDVFFSDGTNTLASIKDQGDYVFWNLKGKTDTGNPATCSEGDIYYNAFDNTVYICHESNTWEQLDGGGASTLQAAYEGGNTISATSAEGNLAFTLTSADFTITTPTGGTNFTSFLRADGAGAADPAQLVLIDNLDADRAQPIGLKIQSAAGGITTALDVSDAEIETALYSGANFVRFDALRLFEGTTGTLTLEDTSNNDMVQIIDQGTTGRLAVSDALQVGSLTSPTAYSRFTDANDVTGHGLSTREDVLVAGKLEVDGTLFLDSGTTIANSVGTTTVLFAADPTTTANTLTAASYLVQNSANVGLAALIVNQQKGGDLFTASASGTTKFTIANNGNVTIDGSGTMLTVGGGTGKIDVGTVDPVYSIAGKKFATYMAGMIGVKEETTGKVATSQYIPGLGYRSVIDFKTESEGSDLWLFSRTTDIKNNIGKMVVLLSPSDNTRTWYEVDEANYTLSIYSSRPTTISYRLTAPRFDYAQWSNYNNNPESTGFQVEDSPLVGSDEAPAPAPLALTDFEIVKEAPVTLYKVYQTISEGSKIVVEEFGAFANLVAGNVKAGAIESQEIATQTFSSFQATVDNMLIMGGLVSPTIQTETISPLADKSDVKVKIGNEDINSGFGELTVENTQGEEVASIDTEGNATFSGTLEAEEIKTNEIIAGKIYADEIVARNGFFGETNTATVSGITREEIEEMLRKVEEDQNILTQASTWNINTATDSANLDELAVSNLYVTEQAAVNSLSVSSSVTVGSDLIIQSTINDQGLTINSIDTLSAPLSIQSLALAPVEIMAGKVRIETNGDVTILGNLYVAGRIESSGLTLKEKAAEDGNTVNENGGFGRLLSLQNLDGSEVAYIDASGSAYFDKLVIAGSVATTSASFIDGLVTETNATAGEATIPPGTREITIKNPKITDRTLVYVTPTSSTLNNVLYVKRKGEGYFVAGFSQSINIYTTFNWWVIDVTAMEVGGN